MIYKFQRYKNVSLLCDFIMLNNVESNISTSVGTVRDNETIEQALNRIGIDFDTIYPDCIIQ